MNYNERMRIFKKIGKQYDNVVWRPRYIPVMKSVFPILRNFKVNVQYEEELPKDGVFIFTQNHCNFYDSMITERALKGNYYCCLASDDPRGTIQGWGFEATGVVWVDRDDKESRRKSCQAMIELLKNNCNLCWCPEGLWCLSDNRLLLHFSHGLARVAIEASKYNKVYIVPLVTTYNYDNDNKVKNADVTVGKSILVNSDMDVKELTEYLEDTMWTIKWNQMEENARKSDLTTPYEYDGETYYLYSRDNENSQKWGKHVEKLTSQYSKVSWDEEMKYEIKTEEQRLQEEMEPYIRKLKRK